jgi:hypothetical protein
VTPSNTRPTTATYNLDRIIIDGNDMISFTAPTAFACPPGRAFAIGA